MLKLEKLITKTRLAARMKERSIFDKAFVKALVWSCVIHLVVLCSFRVKMFEIPQSAPVQPIEVSLETDPQDASQAYVALVDDSQMRSFTDYLDEGAWQDQAADRIQNELNDAPNKGFSTPPTLMLASDPVSTRVEPQCTYRRRAYPLKIKLKQDSKGCKIVEDGSRLFTQKTKKVFLPHSCPHYSIEYEIEIDGASGKIGMHRRTRELRDKTLQTVADDMLHVIRFWTPEPRVYKASLTLTFYCSGEELLELLTQVQ